MHSLFSAWPRHVLSWDRCTLAIEDGRVLCETLKAANGNIDRALKLFNDERHEEVQCCLMMEEVTMLTAVHLAAHVVWI